MLSDQQISNFISLNIERGDSFHEILGDDGNNAEAQKAAEQAPSTVAPSCPTLKILTRPVVNQPTKNQPTRTMKIKSIILGIAIALTMNAHAAKQQQVPITYLPVTITSPGYYYLVTDLVSTVGSLNKAIGIAQQASGDITLDLRGHTITNTAPSPAFEAITVDGEGTPGGAVLKGTVTIENGTLSGFGDTLLILTSSNVIVNNVKFNANPGLINTFGIQVTGSHNVVIANCSFAGPWTTGIREYNELAVSHNSYLNNAFDGKLNNNFVTQNVAFPSVLTIIND